MYTLQVLGMGLTWREKTEESWKISGVTVVVIDVSLLKCENISIPSGRVLNMYIIITYVVHNGKQSLPCNFKFEHFENENVLTMNHLFIRERFK